MNKINKINLIIGIVCFIIISFGVIKASSIFGWNYKKVAISEIDIPQWRTNLIIENPNYMKYKDEYDIVRSTDNLGGVAAKYYSKYIDYLAPNGKPIRILAMDQVSDEQVLYAYDILAFYLKNLGEEVENQISNNGQYLVLPNGADKDGTTPMMALIGQNLNQLEISNIGSRWYIENDYEHRDATFEEIFHLVHDYGIGQTYNLQAMPELAKKIGDAQRNSLPKAEKDWGKSGLWGLDSEDWLKELKEERSLGQEYIVSVIDSYYGLWEAWNEGEGGMWGIYCAKTRDEIKEKDPMGYEVITSFLPENINQIVRIDPTFEGTFLMTRHENIPYTFKSQYLKYVALTGNNDNNIIGNKEDNLFMGNSGNNIIDGGEGNNVMQFRGSSSEYIINYDEDKIIVKDKIDDREGVTTLKNINLLRFIDRDIEVEK